ncbi:serine/threonine-protein kinase [Candidatus Uabimicrobium amorphum]|uniref:Protein kinase n=1 Tax=Uabimicrobium amorphum TaxID=2596890 RepID=A0A5S9F6H1_UABAM|nr:serine/threonine-protein kinase [Candidatus Uabimicrobium amorphum]BBM86262.1 protein kinase [Candidatus Uabimicrobium amorphum]
MDEKQFRTLWSKVVTPEVLDSDKISETYKSKDASFSSSLRVSAQQTFSGDETIHSNDPPAAGTFSGNPTVHAEDAARVTFSAQETFDSRSTAPNKKNFGLQQDYQNYQEINRGGMGIIYKAEQTKLKREIAIKRTLPQVEKNKFLAESLVTAYLDHPNIVPIYEIDEHDEGDLLLAMKLVKGISWKNLLYPQTEEHKKKAEEYDQQKHLQILMNVCNAISYAHSKGIVHCDLKPDNVMIGDFGQVLVMDWGIAVCKIPGEKRTFHKDDITTPMGTPCYMPPELAEGRGKDICNATDIYLLGAILYEILHRKPIRNAKSLWLTLLDAKKGHIPEFADNIPQELRELCLKSLLADTAARHQSVTEFQDSLQNYLMHSESIALQHKAKTLLTNCQYISKEKGKLNEEEQHYLYDNLSQTIVLFHQARELWEENQQISDGEYEARVAYVDLALKIGDLGVANTQLKKLQQMFPEDKSIKFLAKVLRIKTASINQDKTFLSSSKWCMLFAFVAFALPQITKKTRWSFDNQIDTLFFVALVGIIVVLCIGYLLSFLIKSFLYETGRLGYTKVRISSEITQVINQLILIPIFLFLVFSCVKNNPPSHLVIIFASVITYLLLDSQWKTSYSNTPIFLGKNEDINYFAIDGQQTQVSYEDGEVVVCKSQMMDSSKRVIHCFVLALLFIIIFSLLEAPSLAIAMIFLCPLIIIFPHFRRHSQLRFSPSGIGIKKSVLGKETAVIQLKKNEIKNAAVKRKNLLLSLFVYRQGQTKPLRIYFPKSEISWLCNVINNYLFDEGFFDKAQTYLSEMEEEDQNG